MVKKSFAVASLIGGLLLTTSAHAALVAQWNLTGQPGNQSSNVTASAAPEISGGLLGRGAGLTATAAANSINSTGWTAQSSDFYSLSFNVQAGSALDLSTLFVGTRSSGTGPGRIGLFSNQDNFTTVIATVTQASSVDTFNAFNLNALSNFTGFVEFRLYEVGLGGAIVTTPGTQASGTGTTQAGGTFRLIDSTAAASNLNVSFDGTVVSAVPVPAAAWLLVSGVMALGASARRNKKQVAPTH